MDRPALGAAIDLGCFSLVRDQQLPIGSRLPNVQSSPISSRTRSHYVQQPGMLETTGVGQRPRTISGLSDVTTPSAHSTEDNDSLMEEQSQSLSSGQPLQDHLAAVSEHSIADPDMYPQSPGEETVSMAVIFLLRTVSMGCFQA